MNLEQKADFRRCGRLLFAQSKNNNENSDFRLQE